MEIFAVIMFWTLVGLAVAQAPIVGRFIIALFRCRPRFAEVDAQPKTAVILCLRGADPFLGDCLRGILDQDYSQYDLFIVVDNTDDPAWKLAHRIAAEHAGGPVRVSIMPLTERLSTCSLKCSSLLQAIESLNDSYEVVALLDADTVAHPTWLKELVAPFDDPRVGATSGTRWYMPDEPTLGALVRYCWNVASNPQMHWNRIAWGGTLAIRTSVFRQSNLLPRWSRAYCEDSMVSGELKKIGLRMQRVLSLTMVNRETCDTSGFMNWAARQLLAVRLYNRGWSMAIAHGVSTTIALAVAAISAPLALLIGHTSAASYLTGGLAIYAAVMAVMLICMESGVRRIVHFRGEATNWINARTAFRLAVAFMWAHVISFIVLMRAIAIRRVCWRGIDYEIYGPSDIRLIKYVPYGDRQETTTHAASL